MNEMNEEMVSADTDGLFQCIVPEEGSSKEILLLILLALGRCDSFRLPQ